MECGWVMKRVLGLMILAWSTTTMAAFRPNEKDRILAYWNQPDRYAVSTPEGLKSGPWQVRQTPEGSLWLWALNQKRGLGKTFAVGVARNDEERRWEDWIDAKYSYDKWSAALAASLANTARGYPPADLGPEPMLPGAMPESLYRLVGEAPTFCLAVEPKQHTITFHDGLKLTYLDNTAVPHRYAYYRFAEGVRHGGTQVKKMPQAEIDALFNEAGLDARAQRVMKAVSLLEGGFDSVNTYDTGYVSVGFIQFACLSKGAGSLGSVLLRQKLANPASFEEDFRQFGIDVREDGTLIVLGLTDGQEYAGFDAAKEIIRDKRLIAVFQRAGQRSKPFRIAQLQVARDQYYPAEETLALTLGGQNVNVKIGDIVRSEAGLATVMDRKVNTGKTDPLRSKAQEIADAHGVKTVEDLALYERDLVASLRFRKSYLDDDSLSQPAAGKSRTSLQNTTSRKATRKGRG